MAGSADLTGQRFNKLTALRRHSQRQASRTWVWECRCDCGQLSYADVGQLRAGSLKSCGCHRRENARRQHTTHGMTKTRTYITWKSMIARCENASSPDFKHYGGRGITVCARWKTFENFLVDMGERPTDMTLDRRDTDGNYEATNCKWSTAKEQANNRRNNVSRELA